MMQVLVEVLPNIQVCNFYISLPISQKCQRLCFQKSKCTLEFDDETVLTLVLPNGSHLVPNIITDIHQEGNIVAVRVQMDEKASFISALGADLLIDASAVFASEPLHKVLVGDKVSAYCKKCHCQICAYVCFRRVLPLPSVDWDQSSEGWFCHLHGKEGKMLKPTSLIPDIDECFYSEFYFLLHNKVLECMSVVRNSEELISCTGCGDLIGENMDPSLKLWTHSIKWLDRKSNVVFSRSVSEILLSLFENIDRDSFGVNCRLVLKVVSPVKYLYLVTMNTNQKLLLSEFHKNIDDDGTKVNQYNKEHYQNRKMGSTESSDIKLQKLFAIKLLYQMKEGDDDESGSWQDDVDVHILPCSILFFREVEMLLDISSTYLPSKMRKIDGMNVGYIMKN